MSVSERFREMPNFSLRIIDGSKVGTVRLPDHDSEKKPDLDIIDLVAALDQSVSLQRSVAYCICNNSPSPRSGFRVEEAVSAYFTWNPLADELIVEWGELRPDDNTKLHYFLNRAFDYRERAMQGMYTYSGHLAKLKDKEIIACLLDPVSQFSPPKGPLISVISRLQSHGCIVISSEGVPIKSIDDLVEDKPTIDLYDRGHKFFSSLVEWNIMRGQSKTITPESIDPLEHSMGD